MDKWYIVYLGNQDYPSSTVGPFATRLNAMTYMGVVSSMGKTITTGVYAHPERRGIIGKKGCLLKAGMSWAFQQDGRLELLA